MLEPILEKARHKRIVLLGEASHGTREFYELRAELTRSLIADHGFAAMAAEADWPDAYRVNRYVRGRSDDGDAEQALRGFRRFPSWMWRNTDVIDLVEWMRENGSAGFYGIDLYSLHASIEAVLGYLERVDPREARSARERYSCFDHFGSDPQVYGYETGLGGSPSCEQGVVEQLVSLVRREPEYAPLDEDEYFFAQQNARVVANAERYYRAMWRGRQDSWNLRDTHMADSVDALLDHLGPEARIVVWAHNSHIGDARATEMGWAGELNLGQLMRERHRDDVLLVGFTTHHGTVTAASDWGGEAERKRVRPSLAPSLEARLHERGGTLVLENAEIPADQLLERAIGVIYRPETERISHYFFARAAQQFDLLVHVDETEALEPLERTSVWERGELPETYPAGV